MLTWLVPLSTVWVIDRHFRRFSSVGAPAALDRSGVVGGNEGNRTPDA